ncbi:16S rRNA pseudouridine(516) synthase RsuA [Aliidiomarina sp. Khilg15.8]
MRLEKFVSAATGLSRKEAGRVIRAEEIEVDGSVEKKAATGVDESQTITWLGKPLRLTGPRYFMLHKPAGCVCANDDPMHPPVFMYLDEPRMKTLHSVGRLDLDTTGLLLITDDGQWSHRITAPKHACAKTYRATLADPIVEDAAAQLAKGLKLRGETTWTKPAELEVITPTDVRITITEGRYHQVKRMFAALGNKVLALHRERVGGLQLDPELEPGEYRELTEDEVTRF